MRNHHRSSCQVADRWHGHWGHRRAQGLREILLRQKTHVQDIVGLEALASDYRDSDAAADEGEQANKGKKRKVEESV